MLWDFSLLFNPVGSDSSVLKKIFTDILTCKQPAFVFLRDQQKLVSSLLNKLGDPYNRYFCSFKLNARTLVYLLEVRDFINKSAYYSGYN